MYSLHTIFIDTVTMQSVCIYVAYPYVAELEQLATDCLQKSSTQTVEAVRRQCL